MCSTVLAQEPSTELKPGIFDSLNCSSEVSNSCLGVGLGYVLTKLDVDPVPGVEQLALLTHVCCSGIPDDC